MESPAKSPISYHKGDHEYDMDEGKMLADWVGQLADHAASEREKRTRESQWERDWRFVVDGDQWEGSMPSYRYPITVNAWRRIYHVIMATLTGGRPLLKIVPQGQTDPQTTEIWQHALWSLLKTERVMEKWAESISWGLIGDGGWLKVGYGARGAGDTPDVLVSCPHPSKIFPDPECTDIALEECGYILYEDVLDLAAVTRRYPENGHLVKPDVDVSTMGGGKQDIRTVTPAGGWTKGDGYRRARVRVRELWIDDPALEYVEEQQLVDVEMSTLTPEYRQVGRWIPKYPYGRVITTAGEVVLRDIPNPFGSAFGWSMRYPFVFTPMAEAPHRLWRPGLASNMAELQRAINKSQSLILENFIKATNALVIADEQAMDDEEWDMLALFPGAKLRKRQGTDLNIVFPQSLPPQAMAFPDALIRKMDEMVGLHDPPISPGQAVAAKTVAFMQQKGHFLLGEMASLGEGSLERLGMRIAGLQRSRYMPGRKIPMFGGEALQTPAAHAWPELPDSLMVRVEASSGWQEQMAMIMSQAQAGDPRQSSKR